jgi:hypothetical protein
MKGLTMNLEPDTSATNPLTAPRPADPPAGAIQRMAAEMLDLLAEHLDEQPADTGLTQMLTRSAEGAADAHGLPPNPWIRDGIETAALLALAITALPQPLGLLRRDKLADRFKAMTADRQRTWVINAAEVLHHSNIIDSYGPPIGEMLARRAPQTPTPAPPSPQETTPAVASETTDEQVFVFAAWLFSIDQAEELLRSNPREIVQVDITGWVRAFGLDTPPDKDRVPLIGGPGLDRDYAMTTDLTRPLILATVQASGKDPANLLIDGWHRAFRAHAEGRTHLPAYVLTLQETLRIRRHVRETRR